LPGCIPFPLFVERLLGTCTLFRCFVPFDTLSMPLVWLCHTSHIIQNYRIFGKLQALLFVVIVDYLWLLIVALLNVILMFESLIKSFGI